MTSATPDTSTAEWVAEAPSECQGSATGDCTPLTLADFGTAKFTNAYTTSNGHVGSINDSNWTSEAVELVPSSSSLYGSGPGGYFGGGYGYSAYSDYSSSAGEGAAPTSLRDSGTAFSVKYAAALDTGASSSGYGSYGSYGDSYGDGYGDGYGDSGYYGGDSYSYYGDGYGYSDATGGGWGY